MDKVIGYIYETMDYDKFKRLPDNRDVYESRIGKLIASIRERYILNPITVNEKMEVIDGQGRFDARKKLGLPIHYYIVEGATSEDCRRMNKYNTIWKSLDYAKSYAKAGVSSYINLLKACNATGLNISIVLRLSGRGSSHWAGKEGTSRPRFERGELVFTTSDIETAKNTAEMAREIIEALQFTGRPNGAFWTSVKVATQTDGYDHMRMLRNCRDSRSTYTQMSKLSDQLVEFDRIYNKRAKTSNRLYFSDYMRNRGSNVRDYDNCYSSYNDTDVSTLEGGEDDADE